MRRILFTTPYGAAPNYFQTLSPKRFFRINVPGLPFGIRFLKENVPDIETLEFPTWQEYIENLNEVDILGISFFMREAPRVVEMIKAARHAGIKTIIGGGYGVLCETLQPLFDDIYIDHAEYSVAQKLFKKTIDRIKHPPLISSVGIPGIPLKKYAYLFTNRGCKVGCNFCQTPVFVRKVSTLPLESIAEVLAIYKRKKVHTIMIINENFNPDHPHSREVISMIKKHGFEWGCMTRLDLLADKVDRLRETGFTSCIIGLESLTQRSLDFIDKKEEVVSSRATIDELRRNRVTVHVTFMIGYPGDTIEVIRQDLAELAKLDIQTCQIFILTPFPKTPLCELITEKYGIFENDYANYDGFHLVWNHPLIEPSMMRELLQEGYMNFYTKRRFFKHLIQPLIRKIRP